MSFDAQFPALQRQLRVKMASSGANTLSSSGHLLQLIWKSKMTNMSCETCSFFFMSPGPEDEHIFIGKYGFPR